MQKDFWTLYAVWNRFYRNLKHHIYHMGMIFFVSIYTTERAVAVYGIIRMHHVCLLEGVTATYEVGNASLRGMGKSIEPSIITILGTVVFRMIWMVTVFKMVPTYDS